MRKDMDKILVTTPRIGSSWGNFEVKRNRRRFRDGVYDLPSHSSMKPKTKRTSWRKDNAAIYSGIFFFLSDV